MSMSSAPSRCMSGPDASSIIPLQVWDTPSVFDVEQLEVPLSSFSTIIYVIDIQVGLGRLAGLTAADSQQEESYHDACQKFVPVMMRAYLSNRNVKFAVFIHKAEVLSEDYRGGEYFTKMQDLRAVPTIDDPTEPADNYAEVQRAMQEELEDFPFDQMSKYAPNINFDDMAVQSSLIQHLTSELRFDMTSVHDVSLRDAWGKVIQGVMDMLPAVEALLLNFSEVRDRPCEDRA